MPKLRLGHIFLIRKRDSGFSLVSASEAENGRKYNYQPESRKSCHFKTNNIRYEFFAK